MRALALLGASLLLAAPISAQTPDFWLRLGANESEVLEIDDERGFAAFAAAELRRLGWEVSRERNTVTIRSDSIEVRVAVGSPFFTWNEAVLQFTDEPYVERGLVYVPAQFLVDFVPHRVAGYAYDPSTRTLTDQPWTRVAEVPSQSVLSGEAVPTTHARHSRLVVIDPGHGGYDPGAIGSSGVREKDVALGVARALAVALEADSTIEVRLTRDRDVLIPLWRRGEQATQWAGERPGIFISLHANALPASRATRGFETYFLSEARTEHERRVAALENSVDETSGGPNQASTELGEILGELRNHDYQHWSAHLADLVQVELEEVHPGPNRGVKQGPFAVITNALMPAVLVEIGYLTHRAEERLLGRPEFHEQAAGAIARAVGAFFRQYPGGTAVTGPIGP